MRKESKMNENKQRQELADFLRTRRERLSPDAAGFPFDSRRRTPGLRREELAVLAGIGVSWYTRLEQGQDIVVSSQILERLAQVFDLDATERHHLFVLARGQVPTEFYPLTSTIGQELQGLLDSMDIPAYIYNPRWDIIGWNRAIDYLYPGFELLPASERNILRVLFGRPEIRKIFVNYEDDTWKAVALFRATSDRYVQELWFKDLIAELQQASAEFRQLWTEHGIRSVCIGPVELEHPALGLMNFYANTFQVVDSPDLQMRVFTPVEAETARKLEHS
jgi:transcriptional regulator with XRE-family HTH domain